MKILLVYPEFPDTFWSFKHALRFIRKRASAPPLGLLTVAAMLPPDWDLYGVAYRPVRRQEDWIDIWPAPFKVGEPLPTVPLWLKPDWCIPLDLESTYMDLCRRRRLA